MKCCGCVSEGLEPELRASDVTSHPPNRVTGTPPLLLGQPLSCDRCRTCHDPPDVQPIPSLRAVLSTPFSALLASSHMPLGPPTHTLCQGPATKLQASRHTKLAGSTRCSEQAKRLSITWAMPRWCIASDAIHLEAHMAQLGTWQARLTTCSHAQAQNLYSTSANCKQRLVLKRRTSVLRSCWD